MAPLKLKSLRKGLCLAALFTGAVLASPVLAQEVPVMLNDTGEDACGTGIVEGLDPNGDGFLAVRTGPGTEYSQVNSVFNGDYVAICDSSGDWFGIVYGYDGCTGGSPVGDTQNGPYSGPCLAGWVHSNYVQFLAG